MSDFYGQGKIPDDWENGEYCRYAVCWPNSPQWLAILRGVLAFPARGRFWDKNTGIITIAQNIIKNAYDENLHLKEVIMACGDNGLQEIAAAIRAAGANNCCGETVPTNGGISVVVTTPNNVEIVIYGNEPPGSLPFGEVPPDYPGTLAEYDADRCRTAAGIIDGVVSTLKNFSYINWVIANLSIVVVIGAVAGAIIVPQVLIPIIIAAAVGHVGIAGAMRSLADGIAADKDNLVCIMMQNESTKDIIAIIADAIDVIIAAIPATGGIAIALKTLALVLFNATTINQLMTLQQGAGEPYDCSGCSEWTNFTDGPITRVGPSEWLLEASGPNCDEMLYSVAAYYSSPADMTISVDSGSLVNGGATSPSCQFIYRAFYCNAIPILENTDTPPTMPYLNSGFTIRSAVPFVLRVVIENPEQDCP